MPSVRTLLAERRPPLVMGILNRTPDSFSDGGSFLDDARGLERALELHAEGADIIDVGAESTRPGAESVPAREQIDRLGDFIAELTQRGVVVSIDTTLPEVASFALDQGASIINSVSLEPAAELAELAQRRDADLVLMHCRGSMKDMGGFSVYPDEAYGDVVTDVGREWMAAAGVALSRGLARERLVLDPGLGFAKNARQSTALCARLSELRRLGFPILVGPSRKSFVAPGSPPHERLGGTIAATLACVSGGADLVRAHDVAPVRQALALWARVSPTSARPDRGESLHA
jgi:dihydropteroate synthase